MGYAQHDVMTSSQFGGAPQPTQPSQDDYITPAPTGRPTQQVVPPSPLTYSADHVRAGRRAPRPGAVRGVMPKRGRY